jgi:nucleoside-diphosphate-sugar epimerase
MRIYRFIEGIKNDKEIQVFGDGTQKRDFTYVGDIAEGTVRALKPLGYETINLGNNNPVELNYVIELIEKELDRKAKIKYLPRNKADVLINYANIDKAKKLLNWEPTVKIEEGITRTVAWHLQQKK